jgi:hypothetical protein
MKSNYTYLLAPKPTEKASTQNVTLTDNMLNRLSIYLSVCGSTALMDLDCFFSFLIYIQTVGLLGRGISLSEGRYLHTGQHKQNKNTQTAMPRVGFEPTISVFERAKTGHALDLAATVIGSSPL